MHTNLLVGSTLYLQNSTMYPQVLIESIGKHKITGFAGVPSTYSLLLGRTKLDDADVSSLRYVLQAGGPMPVATINEVRQRLCSGLYVMYGQTEATARLTCLQPSDLDTSMGSVGKPIPGVSIEIRRKDGSPCNPDEHGELYAKGDNITPGYWKNPEASARTLSNGWLKTGDMGHKDKAGFIYIQGRRSDMIKTGANRVSPNEIEEVVTELPDIMEAAAVSIPDKLLGEAIGVCVVLRPNASLNLMAIKRHCLENLAPYKIPKKIKQLESLPKTASGKVKRHMLQDLIKEESS